MADPTYRFGSAIRPAMGLDLGPRRADLGGGLDQSGLRSLYPSPADAEVQGQRALNQVTQRPTTSIPLRPPPESDPLSAARGPRSIYYSPSLDRFSVGGLEFGSKDYDIALQAPQYVNREAGPQTAAPDWKPVSQQNFNTYLSSISEGRGFLGNVGMGFRDVGEGVVGGVGRGLQMLGAEGAGQALVTVGEFLGPTAADEARDAAIRAQQGLGQQILTAGARSLPTVALAIAGGVGGGALAAGGLRAAAAGGTAARAGQLAGVSATIFPMEVQSSYTAAQQGGYDVNDPEVQADIWATAATKTIAQTLPEAFLAGAFSRAFGTALRDAGKRTLRNTVGPIVGVGSAEAAAETFATLADRVMFDPELRAQFNERDWAALAPLIVAKYGEEGLVAAGAGFLLGGGFRAAAMPFEGGRAPTDVPPPNRDLTGTGETDVLNPQALSAPEERLALPYYPEQGVLASEQQRALPAPRVGLLGPSTVVTPPPATDTAPIIMPPPGAIPMAAMPEGLEGPVAQGFQRAAAAGPAYRLPTQPVPAPPLPLTRQQRVDIPFPLLPQMRTDISTIATRRTDLPPGAQRLRAQRPSERAETYAPAPADKTAMGEQLNRLMAQARARQEAEAAARATQEAQAAQEAAQRTQRESQLLRSRREQQQLEADTNILGEELVGGDFDILGADARAEWDAAVAALDPEVRAEILEADPESGIPTSFAAQQAQADLARLGAAIRNRRSNKLRRQAAEPPTVIAPEAAPTPTTTPAREKARNRAIAIAKANNTAVAVEGRPYKDDPTSPPIHEVALPDGTLVRIAKTTNMGLTDWVDIDTGANLFVDTKSEAIKKLSESFRTPPMPKEAEATGVLSLFRAGKPGADPAPDGFMYLADSEAAAKGGARQPVRSASIQFTTLLRVASRSELDQLLGTSQTDKARADAARAAGYDGVAIARNSKSARPWTEYFALYPDNVTLPPDGGAGPKGGKPRAVQKQGAKARTLRKGPEAGPRVRGEDTQEQEAAGARGPDIFEQTEEAPRKRVAPAPGPRRTAAQRREAELAEAQADLTVGVGRTRAPAATTPETRDAATRAAVAERVDALTDDQLTTLQVALEATPEGYTDIDRAIELDPDLVTELLNEIETATRTEIEAAAQREAEAEPAPVVDETADLAPQLWDDIRFSRADRPELPKFDDLPEAQQDAWIAAVEAGKFAKNKDNPPPPEAFAKWREAGLRVAPDEDPIRTFSNLVDAATKARRDTGDFTDTFDNIQDAEKKLAGAKRRKSMSQEEIDAGVDLLVMVNDPEMPVEVRNLATESLEAQVNPAQYAELVKVYQRRSELERLNGGTVDPVAQASAELADIITGYNADPLNTTLNEGRFTALMRMISEAGRENTQAAQLLDYARSSTDLRPNMKAGKITPRPRGLAAATSLENYNTLDGLVYPDGRDVRPMPTGKLRLAVSAFVRKLKVKPKVHVFANQADLKRKDPALYKRAVAARPQGDFDTVAASGYFFGDNDIIIFSDRIANSGHLNTVLAHETMGHFGLRAIIGEARFNQVMEGLYNRSPREAKELIDRAMAARGLSRAEATEEYLSDYAARIETSLLRRWWAAIKDALNALGLRFNDDDARYLMAQARRYVKNGDTSSLFDAHVMALQNHAMANGSVPNGTGRFSHANQSTDLFDVLKVIESSDFVRPRTFDGALDGLDGALGVAKRLTGDAADIFDAVKRSVFSPTVWRGIRNEGFQEGIRLLKKRYDIARREIAAAEQLRSLALNPQVNIGGYKFGAGLDAEGRERAGFAMKMNRIGHSFKYRPKRNPPSIFAYNPTTDTYQLVRDKDGVLIADKLKQSGRYTREQFAEGVTIRYETTENMTEAERTRLRAERDAELAKIPEANTAARKRVERNYEARIKDNSYPVVRSRTVKHTFTDKEWAAFNQELDSIAAITVKWLGSHLTRYNQETTSTYRKIASVMSAPMTAGDRKMIDRFVQRFNEIMVENVEFDQNGQRIASSIDVRRAEAFALNMNAALLGAGTDRIDALFAPDKDGKTFMPVSERAEITAAIKDFKTRYSPPEATPGRPRGPESFVVQAEVRSLANQLMLRQDAETRAVQTLETGYVPFARKGNVQVRVAAIGANGREYTISDRYRKTLPYFLAETSSEAESIKNMVNELLRPDPNTTHTLEVFDPEANNGLGGNVLMEIQLVAKREAALTAPAADPELNLNESLRFLRRFNVNLDPVRSEQIIRAFVTQNDSMLTRQFKAEFTPGSENDLTSVISQHIESRASTIARNETSVELGNLLDRSQSSSRLKWSGDPVKYDRLKAEMERVQADPSATEDAKDLARRRFDEYHSWFVTNDSQGNENKYYSEFRRVVDFLDQQKDVLETDLAASKTVSSIQMWTSVSFLMGSIASGGLNLVGMQTNVLPALVSYNPKNGFGGGFGTKGATELYRSIKIAGLGGKFDTSKYWSELSDAELQRKGITRAAADFMAKGIDGGFLQAAQTNALMGTSRGRMRSGLANKAIMTAMLPFNWTEQASRRASALAAFNLEYDRQIAAGVDPQKATETAERFAENLVDFTLGNYTTMGRPTLFRGGPQQFLFMFKMFVVNSAALLGNLSWGGKAIMLGSLLLLSGLRGVPFAEDMEDIVDTLAQKLGIPMGSVRAEMIKLGDQLYPGFGKMLVSGAINEVLGGTDFGARTSLGNIVPGSSIFLAGGDTLRELEEIGGPMVSFAKYGALTAGNILDFVPGGTPGDVETLLREQPISILRAVGDMIAYQRSGAIVDKRGYIISDEFDASTMLWRGLGFYPKAASDRYSIVSMDMRQVEYQRAVKLAFRDKIVKAQSRGDMATVRALYRDIDDWNRRARGTGLEVRGMRDSVQRALRSQRMTATERFSAAQARDARRFLMSSSEP